MPSPLQSVEPKPLWSHFDAIRQVPRPSKHEERISEYVRGWADSHGFTVRADASGNLVVVVPASLGREAGQLIVLQAHLDMVCEKNAGVGLLPWCQLPEVFERVAPPADLDSGGRPGGGSRGPTIP